MKILKPGTEYRGWQLEFQCTGYACNNDRGCRAVLLVDEMDTYAVELGSGMDDVTETHAAFKCPCGIESAIKDKKIKPGHQSKKDWLDWVEKVRKANSRAISIEDLK